MTSHVIAANSCTANDPCGVGVRLPAYRFSKAQIMNPFPVHTIASAPEKSRDSLDALESAFGMLPSIAGAMATSPVLIEALVALFGKVHGGTFSEDQIQIVLLTDAVVNASKWPVAFHTALALQQGIAPSDVDAIREGRLPSPTKYAALSALARAMIEKRGQLESADLDTFMEAGFDSAQVLELIAIVAASTITNYTANITANITEPPLESLFAHHAWIPA